MIFRERTLEPGWDKLGEINLKTYNHEHTKCVVKLITYKNMEGKVFLISLSKIATNVPVIHHGILVIAIRDQILEFKIFRTADQSPVMVKNRRAISLFPVLYIHVYSLPRQIRTPSANFKWPCILRQLRIL